MKTVTFYSYKGGVGRTLALANMAKRLADFGKKVCVIDFDLEAPGLHQKFGRNLNQDNIKKGIVDYIYEFSYNNRLPESIQDYSIKMNTNNLKNKIDIIPAGNIKTKGYWRKLAQINWGGLFYEKDSQGVAFFIDLKQKIEKEIKPDFLLIDSRTGISDISGVTLSILADEVVILLTKNEENIEGTKLIVNTLSVPENTFIDGRPKINIVLSRIPYFLQPEEKYKEYNAKKHVLSEINNGLKKNKSDLSFEKLLVIHSDPDLQLDEKLKIGYEYSKDATTNETPIGSDYLSLFNEITKDSLSDKEKKRFDTLKKSEYLIDKAKQTPDNAVRIKILNEAVQLNPKSGEAYYELAVSYQQMKDYSVAEQKINDAIKIDTTDANYQYAKGVILAFSGKYIDAKKIFTGLLLHNKSHYGALLNMGKVYYLQAKYKDSLKYFLKLRSYYANDFTVLSNIGNNYRVLGDYEKAFDYVYKSLELDPRNKYATGTLAEIYAETGNLREFYKNLDLSFLFGMTEDEFNRILKDEKVYEQFFNDKKFLNILEKYNIKIQEKD